MSLNEFPPIESADRPVCLQEINGGLMYGTVDDLLEMENNELLSNYPKIEKDSLKALQHSLPNDCTENINVNNQRGFFQDTMNTWKNKGLINLTNCVASVVNSTPYIDWFMPVGRVIKKAQEDIRNTLVESKENLHDSIGQTSSTLNWLTNWLRCIAVHVNSEQIAVCDSGDHITIFNFLSDESPLTLKHHCQQNVTDMAWKPYDRTVLAVACSDAVIIWRLEKQNMSIRTFYNSAEVIQQLSFTPVTQCFWDSIFDRALFIVSTSSSRLQVLDTSNGEVELIGSWSSDRIRNTWVSPDGCKLAFAYFGNCISVYDRGSWNEERWKKLNGHCTAAAWTPMSDVLFFATRNESFIRAIHFIKNLRDAEDDQRTIGSEKTIPVYDFSEIEMEDSERKRKYTVGGTVRDIKISPDGQRVIVAFSAYPTFIALFVFETVPSFLFVPCGLINGEHFGSATIMSFFPKFQYGSMLMVAWSAGRVQYIPLFYGHRANEGSHLNQTARWKYCAESFTEDLFSGEIRRRTRSRSTDHNRSKESDNSYSRGSSGGNSAASSSRVNDFKLFSSSGLYDQLLMKSAEKSGTSGK